MRSRWPLPSLLSLLLLLLAVRQAVAEDNYEVGPEDILAISVLAQPAMTGDFTIDRDGMLTFPALGKIKASGMTATEFERKLTTLLADGYVKRPQLSVTVKEYKSQRVLVTGAIPKPGPYALKGDRSARAFLGELGNLGPDAGHEIIVTRPPAVLPVDGSEPRAALGEIPTDVDNPLLQQAEVPGAHVFTLSLQKAMAGDPEHNILLQAGDTIFFPKARQIYISGQVGRAGPYRYQEGMTILQALTLAGGVGPRGAAGRVKIVRIVDGEKQEIKPKPTDTVQPEDTLVVPERFF